MKQTEEKILRENIRELIRFVKEKKAKTNLNEEAQLRSIIKSFLDYELTTLNEVAVPDNKPTPNKSTGINVLEDLLTKIIPVLETDYKLMTTNPEQRESFRAHIINAVIKTLTPAIMNDKAEEDTVAESIVDEEIDVDIVDDEDITDDEKFIDIRTDAEKAQDEDEEEVDPRDEFGSEVDADETGRNMAFQTYNKVNSNILDAYDLLANPEDQELFYDYLIANLKLYFDKFEGELDADVEEPTNQAYDMAKGEEAGGVEGEEELGGEEELDFEL